MLIVNNRILYDMSHIDTTWLRRPELKIEKVINWQISWKKEVLIKVTYELSEEKSREVNELESEREMCFLIERSSNLEHKYWFVVRLKAIEYKEDFSLLFIFLRPLSGFLIFIISRCILSWFLLPYLSWWYVYVSLLLYQLTTSPRFYY